MRSRRLPLSLELSPGALAQEEQKIIKRLQRGLSFTSIILKFSLMRRLGYYRNHGNLPSQPDHNWRIVPDAARQALHNEALGVARNVTPK